MEIEKLFRQGAAILIQQQFQKLLDDAKSALAENSVRFKAEFGKSSGLRDHSPQAMQTAISEYVEDSNTRIRFLERDLKLVYLGGKLPSDESLRRPTNKVLLRPNLPQVPRLINFSKRDKHQEKIRHRAEHQLSLMNLLKV